MIIPIIFSLLPVNWILIYDSLSLFRPKGLDQLGMMFHAASRPAAKVHGMIIATAVMECTLWLFNIAMENGPFIDVLPIKTSIYKGFPCYVK